MYARLFLILLALFSLDAKAQTIQESVAFAIIGEPKYAAGFSHLITSIQGAERRHPHHGGDRHL